MGTLYERIDDHHRSFIERQRIFFVATAPRNGRLNLSPKGMDTLRVVEPNRVLWLNLTGSGNETAAHLLEDGRMTLMFCTFEGDPLTLRLYGSARAIHEHQPVWTELIGLLPTVPGARQIVDMQVDSLQTSCGIGVPRLDYAGEREQLCQWAEKKGPEGVRRYQREKNRLSIDGKPTDTGSADEDGPST
jgi:hypothetical protein